MWHLVRHAQNEQRSIPIFRKLIITFALVGSASATAIIGLGSASPTAADASTPTFYVPLTSNNSFATAVQEALADNHSRLNVANTVIGELITQAGSGTSDTFPGSSSMTPAEQVSYLKSIQSNLAYDATTAPLTPASFSAGMSLPGGTGNSGAPTTHSTAPLSNGTVTPDGSGSTPPSNPASFGVQGSATNNNQTWNYGTFKAGDDICNPDCSPYDQISAANVEIDPGPA